MTFVDGLSGVTAEVQQLESIFSSMSAGAGSGFDSVMAQISALPAPVGNDAATTTASAPAPDLSGNYGWPFEEGQTLTAAQQRAFGDDGGGGGQTSSGSNTGPVSSATTPTTTPMGAVVTAGASGTLASSTTSGTTTSPSAATTSTVLAPGTDNVAPGISGSQVVADADKYLGVPYQWGGTNPATGVDCSGLVQDVFKDLGVSLPRTAAEQSTIGAPVASLAEAQPGDLIFFAGADGTAVEPGHVGIYVGNGEMIDAPHTGASVRTEAVSDAGTPTAIRRIAGGTTTALGQTTEPVPGEGAYSADFAKAASLYSVPQPLLTAVAQTESSFEPGAVSNAGAEGLMQLMPSTAASLGVDPFDPAQAIDGAARLLSSYYSRYGSWSDALAAYNAGPQAVESYSGIPPYQQTQQYVQTVLTRAGMEAQ